MNKPNVVDIGAPGETRDFLQRHEKFFDRLQNLMKALTAAFTRTVDNTELSDKVIFYLGRVCCEEFMEILVLSGNGYGIGALKILRGLYEKAVTARYLHGNPELAEDFLDYYRVSQHKLIAAIERTFGPDVLPKKDVEEANAEFAKVKGKFEIDDCKDCGTKRLSPSWSKLDFVSMTSKVPSLSDLLAPAYYVPTEHAHSNPGAVLRRLGLNAGGTIFEGGAQRDEADQAFFAAHRIILDVVELQKDHFQLAGLETLHADCKNDFVEIWGEGTSAEQKDEPDNSS